MSAPVRATARSSSAPRRAPERSRRPDLRVVTEAPPRRRRLASLRSTIVVAIGLFIAVLFALAAVSNLMAEGQFELGELEAELEALEARRFTLQLEVEQLESPERIAGIALDELGMVAPTETVDLYPTAEITAEVFTATHPTPDAATP